MDIQAKIYIHQLCAETRCHLENLSKVMVRESDPKEYVLLVRHDDEEKLDVT